MKTTHNNNEWIIFPRLCVLPWETNIVVTYILLLSKPWILCGGLFFHSLSPSSALFACEIFFYFSFFFCCVAEGVARTSVASFIRNSLFIYFYSFNLCVCVRCFVFTAAATTQAMCLRYPFIAESENIALFCTQILYPRTQSRQPTSHSSS